MNDSTVLDTGSGVSVKSTRHQRLRRLAFIGVPAALALSLSSGLTAPANAEEPGVGELASCVSDPNGCFIAKDAANWALGVAEWKYGADPDGLHNGAGDAFRHCIWSAAITQRIGADRAEAITTEHEDAESDEPQVERDMDLGNNAVGRNIGSDANAEGGSDTWGWIIDQCQEYQQAGLLYLPGIDPWENLSF